MNFKGLFNKKNSLIILILFFAFLTRIFGIDYGLPYFFIGDEQPLVAGALKMAQLKTLLPVFHPDEFRPLYYPPLMSYIYLLLLSPFILFKYLLGSWASFVIFQKWLILNPGFIWLLARIFNALIGTATIYLIYSIGRKIFNSSVGLLSALFLSLSFFHVQLSHFTRHWVPAVFFAYLVIWFSFCIRENPRKRYYIWTGIAAGLAFGISYITAIALLPFLIIHFWNQRESFARRIKDKNLWLMLMVFILITSIFVVLHPQEFFRILIGEDSTAGLPKNLTGFLSSFVYYLKVMVFYEPIILIFVLLGCLVLWLKSKKDCFIFLFLPVIYITILYFFFHHEARYIVLVIPWLCLLAGYGIYSVFKNIRSRAAIALLLLLVFVYPLVVVKYDYLLSQKDTRILAKEWIEKNISTDNKIITNWRGIKLISTKQSILLQREIDENSLRTDDKTLLSLEDRDYPQPSFNVLRLHFIDEKLSDDLSEYIRENDYKYFVVQYWKKNELSRQDQSIIKHGQIVKKFDTGLNDYSLDINGNILEPIYSIFSMERLGPIVEIYQL